MATITKPNTLPLNPLLKGLAESDTLAINERTKRLVASGKKMYRFGLGQSPFPVPTVVVESLKKHAAEKDYLPVKGLLELRKAVAGFHKRKDGVDADPNRVLIGPGSKELVFLLQLVFDGEIIIVSPCWVSYIPQAKILGKEISIIHSSFENKWHLTPEIFKTYLEQRDNTKPGLMILNYPGNPDGVTINAESLKAIADLARKHHIYILSDEIYGQLNHLGQHVSIGKFYPEGTIISSGLSKWCGAGGWRLGTFTFPESLNWMLEKMAIVASETYTSVSAPIQYAAVTAFNDSQEIDNYLLDVQKILRCLGKESARIFLDKHVKLHMPEGGFYFFLDFSYFSSQLIANGISTSKDFCERLLEETGVAMLPGSSFSRNENEFTARMAYVDFDGAEALAAVKNYSKNEELTSEFTSKHCSNVIEGVKIVTEWLTNFK